MASISATFIVVFCLAILKASDISAASAREFKPVVTVPESRVGQALNNTVAFSCRVLANPVPATYWYKDGEEIKSDTHYRISRFSTSDTDPDDFSLYIKNVRKADYGKYICKAVNALGSIEQVVELYETKEPQCQFMCD